MIRILSETFIDKHELEIILWLLDAGLDYYHFRKEHIEKHVLIDFLSQIPNQYRAKIVLHHSLPISGFLKHHKAVDCKSENNQIHSCSAHTEEEVILYLPYYKHVFWSPVFDSISKVGYNQNKHINLLCLNETQRKQVIALGGIQPLRFKEVKQMGFSQVAIKGWFWNRKLNYKQAWREIQTSWQE